MILAKRRPIFFMLKWEVDGFSYPLLKQYDTIAGKGEIFSNPVDSPVWKEVCRKDFYPRVLFPLFPIHPLVDRGLPAISKGICSFPPCVWYRHFKVKPTEQIKDTSVINSNRCTFKWFELYSLQRPSLTLWFKKKTLSYLGGKIPLMIVHLKKKQWKMFHEEPNNTWHTWYTLSTDNSPWSHFIELHSLKRNNKLFIL